MSSSGLLKYGGLASAVMAIAGLAALVGFKADRPAWSSDIVAIRTEFEGGLQIAQATAEDAQRRSVSQALRLNDIRTGENQQAIFDMVSKGQQVPGFLRELEADLKRERRDLDAIWKELTQ